jgi:hypothetical protein
MLWPSRVGLQFGYSVSEWLLGLFASLLTWRCTWGRVAELSVWLPGPLGFRLVLYGVNAFHSIPSQQNIRLFISFTDPIPLRNIHAFLCFMLLQEAQRHTSRSA